MALRCFKESSYQESYWGVLCFCDVIKLLLFFLESKCYIIGSSKVRQIIVLV